MMMMKEKMLPQEVVRSGVVTSGACARYSPVRALASARAPPRRRGGRVPEVPERTVLGTRCCCRMWRAIQDSVDMCVRVSVCVSGRPSPEKKYSENPERARTMPCFVSLGSLPAASTALQHR